MRLPFRWVREDRPGERWLELHGRAWPSYRHWFLREGSDARPGRDACAAALERHMPELVPRWKHLTELGGGGDELARMLSLWCPTPYLAGCSQATWDRDEPRLVRNYDYRPDLCEGVFLASRWAGTRVVAASDCLWGCLDGMNEHGLAVALAYGGRPVVGEGFGIPLILRWVLEFCRTTKAAKQALARIPSHMAYNVSLLDAGGEYAVVRVSPGRRALVRRERVATNHQRADERGSYARATKSHERKRHLEARLADPELTTAGLRALFLEPPLFQRDGPGGVATLYSVEYRPRGGRMLWFWPGSELEMGFDDYREHELSVDFEKG